MTASCHILVEGNPAIIYASRRGAPKQLLPILKPFLRKFWQERETLGEYVDTPECLVAQIIVRFGFEICEDDFSNLRVGVRFNPTVDYLYQVVSAEEVRIWVPEPEYRQHPAMGLTVCRPWVQSPLSQPPL